jgi:hypothetical protein
LNGGKQKWQNGQWDVRIAEKASLQVVAMLQLVQLAVKRTSGTCMAKE